jgi:2-polyprenyl-3-methyl-5-hydroxy-6-metoxy-1,4-benzoquinol methylase
MTSKSNRASPGFKQKFRNLVRPYKQLEPMIKDIEEQLEDLRVQLQDLRVQQQQFISLKSLQYQLPPIPPKHLQVRIGGAYNPRFFNHGQDMFRQLEAILKSQGLSIFEFKNILDFGCGCGRFMIPMSFLMDPRKLSGTDIDAEAVEWLRKNYPCFNDLSVNQCAPPTKYADGAYDFVYGVSIFTHLPEDMQHVWLKELARIIAPGGWGVFTTHGEKHHHVLS